LLFRLIRGGKFIFSLKFRAAHESLLQTEMSAAETLRIARPWPFSAAIEFLYALAFAAANKSRCFSCFFEKAN